MILRQIKPGSTAHHSECGDKAMLAQLSDKSSSSIPSSASLGHRESMSSKKRKSVLGVSETDDILDDIGGIQRKFKKMREKIIEREKYISEMVVCLTATKDWLIDSNLKAQEKENTINETIRQLEAQKTEHHRQMTEKEDIIRNQRAIYCAVMIELEEAKMRANRISREHDRMMALAKDMLQNRSQAQEAEARLSECLTPTSPAEAT